MENQFLVICKDNSKRMKAGLTNDKIYLVTEHPCNNDFFCIIRDDKGGSSPWYKYRFEKLTFVDVWELKRNGTYFI